MYPPVLMFRPDLAKAMLKYRIQGIPEAQARARQGGYNGARKLHKHMVKDNSYEVYFSCIDRFPWESAFTGTEVTPDVCPECRENQQHITGDIAWAARTFVAVTQDMEWLCKKQPGSDFSGNDLIVEMAKFWESRPTYNRGKGQWETNGARNCSFFHHIKTVVKVFVYPFRCDASRRAPERGR